MTNDSPIQWHLAPEVIQSALQKVLLVDVASGPELAELNRAMSDAALIGGKRLRAQLVLESGFAVCARNKSTFDAAAFLPTACAIELIHAYSLVHDDLPAMDNADTRRGQPSCHKKYGEAQAILAGDGLLNLAYEVLLNHANSPAALEAAKVLSRAAGTAGMVGGQYEDISWSNTDNVHLDAAQLFAMQSRKTGALICAATECGAILAGASDKQREQLRQYGIHLGRAFQLRDDVLDVEGDPELTGKESTDDDNDKLTAPALLGLEETKRLAQEASTAAINALHDWNNAATVLKQIAQFAVTRDK